MLYSSDTEVQMVRNQRLTMYFVRILISEKHWEKAARCQKVSICVVRENACFFQNKEKKIKGNRHISFLLFFSFISLFSCLNTERETLNKPTANQGF